jgi:GT2 family glycosyltransferase
MSMSEQAFAVMAGSVSEISAAVVSFNTRERTLECLSSVQQATAGFNTALMLVDNGSTDGTVQAVRRCFPAWEIVVLPDNPGYGAALNRAFALAPARYHLALNSDVVLYPNTVHVLRKFMGEHPSCGVVGPLLSYPDGRQQASAKRAHTLSVALGEVLWLHTLFPSNRWCQRFYYADLNLSVAQWVETVSGAVLLFDGDAYRRVGGFDEAFRMYFEEVDLCIRLQQAGYRVSFYPDAKAVHLHAASTRQTTVRQVEYYVSYVRFMHKHRGALAGRIFTAAVALHGVLRAVALFVKYPPYSKSQRAILGQKLEACAQLLKALASYSAGQAAGVRS